MKETDLKCEVFNWELLWELYDSGLSELVLSESLRNE